MLGIIIQLNLEQLGEGRDLGRPTIHAVENPHLIYCSPLYTQVPHYMQIPPYL